MSKKIIPISIAVLAGMLVFANFIHLVAPYVKNATQALLYVENVARDCKPNEVQITNKLVVLRIDDIRGDLWTDVGVKMIRDATRLDVRPVLGVIPENIKQDIGFYQFLKNNQCNFEIAQHGLTHNYKGDYDKPEFGVATYDEAYIAIEKGKSILSELVWDHIITFIPPQNIYSQDTGKAITDLGFSVISGDEGNGIYDLDTATKLYEFDDESLVTAEEILAECDIAVKRKNLCVIATHPQDYATNFKFDAQKYEEYLGVIDTLKENGYSFVTFYDLERTGIIPGWTGSRK